MRDWLDFERIIGKFYCVLYIFVPSRLGLKFQWASTEKKTKAEGVAELSTEKPLEGKEEI